MLLAKKGFPQESELVLCTVTKIYSTSIFVELDEYENKTGMINISEIAPGRIRNLRDYVEEGKKIVCKVLKVDFSRGHIDLSYRRVNENQRRLKVDQIKQEQKCEKIIEDACLKLKLNSKFLYNDIIFKISKDYDNLSNFFIDVSSKKSKIEDYVKDPKIAEILKDLIEKRVKPPIVEINGEITFYSKNSNGIDIIKQILGNFDDNNSVLIYEGGGKYKIKITSNNYKTAENILKSKLKFIENASKKEKAIYEFKRIETKK